MLDTSLLDAVSVHGVNGGALWALKGQPGVLDDVFVRANLHQERESHHPFGAPDRRSAFTPERVAIETTQGDVVEALNQPRAWDPALIDALAAARRVVTFDNTGVGSSTGTTPNTVEQMVHDATAFLTAMEFGQVDIIGFSPGNFVAQEIALIRPELPRRLVLASRRVRRRCRGIPHRTRLDGDRNAVGECVRLQLEGAAP